MAEAFALAWATNGSIDAADWLPYAIGTALLLTIVLAATAAAVPARLATAGAGLLLLLAAWQALSLTWSPLPELARNDALLTLFYVAVVLVAAVTIRNEGQRLAAAGWVALGCGVLAVASVIQMRTANDVSLVFPRSRLAFPIDYENAQAAAFLVGFWPGILIGSRRGLPVVVRGLALGCATACTVGWLLTQSKGGAVGLGVSLVVVLALSRERLRLVPPLALALGSALAFYGPLTAPYEARTIPALAVSVRHSAALALVSMAVGLVLGLVYALVDRQLELSRRTRALLARLALAALLVAVAGGVAGYVVVERHPVGFLQARWRSFKHYPTKDTASSHFLSIGSNRYDFWRVALHTFAAHPLAGVGERGFQAVYLQKRHGAETPARAHSVEADLLAETGIVGFLLWLGGFGALLLAAARGARRLDAGATAAVGAGVYFLVHSSVDWTWSFPAVGVPAFVLLGAGASRHVAAALRPVVALPVALVSFLVAALAFAPPWLSSRLTASGTTNASLSNLHDAKRLDPLAVEPYVAQAAIATTPAGAITPLQQAAAKEPRSVGLHYELALAELRAGRRAEAKRQLLVARSLDPGDVLIAQALARLRRGR